MSHPLNTKPDQQNPIPRKPPLRYNPLTNMDSYKPSQWSLYPKDMESYMGYFESRGGLFAESTLFGLQPFLHQYLSHPYTLEDVEEAADFWARHGEPFNKQGYIDMYARYKGHHPVCIRAIPEGTVVPTGNLLFTVESTDKDFAWAVSPLETSLVQLWYPSTIAIQSREFGKVQKDFLDRSSDTPEEDLIWKVHCFGQRGATCLEQARNGSAAHLLTFRGSDTAEAIRFANHYYDCDMSGFSIWASEHSNVCSWGKEHEFDFYRNFVKQALTDRVVPDGMPKVAACVSDAYNVFEAVRFWCSPEMRQILKDSGGTLVIRPDSGPPVETLVKIFDLLEEQLGEEITVNSKGFKVLPPYLRVIQGDGINLKMMRTILWHLVDVQGWSATNIAFGSGGGLLQQVNRDTQKFAFKCCAIKRNGKVVEVFKDPVTDQGKRSKSGRLDLIKTETGYETVKLPDNLSRHPDSVLETVFHNGNILYHTTLDECRARMAL